MDGEQGINAFAAGWDVSGAVVAVTRGTLQTLTRDELQGVIAHEFSHILNGDMRLNIRMIGVLAGIVFIGSIGGFIMRSVGPKPRPQGLGLGRDFRSRPCALHHRVRRAVSSRA
jgi:Zn-dependent protease with chaperone function